MKLSRVLCISNFYDGTQSRLVNRGCVSWIFTMKLNRDLWIRVVYLELLRWNSIETCESGLCISNFYDETQSSLVYLEFLRWNSIETCESGLRILNFYDETQSRFVNQGCVSRTFTMKLNRDLWIGVVYLEFLRSNSIETCESGLCISNFYDATQSRLVNRECVSRIFTIERNRDLRIGVVYQSCFSSIDFYVASKILSTSLHSSS